MISAFLIVRNEAANLEPCLAGVAWADEIVIVDAESDDGTADVARRFTDRVFTRRFTHFAEQKNFALSHVRGEWAFSIDADERVPPALRDEILRTVADPAPAAGYRVARRSYFRGQWMRTLYPDHQTRLFRSRAARFVGIVHETVEVDGEVRTLQEPLDHHGMPSVATFVRKIRRYAALDARKRLTAGERFAPWSPLTQPVRELRRWLVDHRVYRDGWNGILVAGLMAGYAASVAWHGSRPAAAPAEGPEPGAGGVSAR